MRARSISSRASRCPRGGNNFTNITFINSHSTFQIPNDVANGEPAVTDDNETQADTFLAVQFHHRDRRYGRDYVRAGVQGVEDPDFGDPMNDWIYGEALNVEPPPYGNGGTSTDCANADPDRQLCVQRRAAIRSPISGPHSTTSCRATTRRASGSTRVAAGVSYDLLAS